MSNLKPSSNIAQENDVLCSKLENDCMQTTSILLEPSEYFFDDDFSVPFDANLRDEKTSRRLHIDESDEGISSSGTTNRGLVAPTHTRSDSCLFSQPDSGSSPQDVADSRSGQRFDSPSNTTSNCVSNMFPAKSICSPDSTSTNLVANVSPRIRRTLSADFSLALHEINDGERLFDQRDIAFGELPQTVVNDAASVTTSWMKAVLEGSSCPQLQEILKRTTVALDYRLAWEDLQTGTEDGAINRPCNKPQHYRLRRSTSHDNILTAASLAGMRQTLANIKVASPKQFRSVGVSTSDNERSSDDVSLPDTTTATTTWARIRNSRESLNSKKGVHSSDTAVIPPLAPQTPNKPFAPSEIPESAVKWRALKEVGACELTTWGQLHRTASFGNRKREEEDPAHMHASLMPPKSRIPLRSPLSRKAMHRYSGTLLEIFMRARAQSLVTSSCTSSFITAALTQSPPPIMKQLGHPIAGQTISITRSLQTNLSALSLGTDTEHTPIGAFKRPNNAFLKMGMPAPKISAQPPPTVPPRRSSFISQQHAVHGNRSGGEFYQDRPLSAMPPASLLTMSADPESECMSRLREGSSLAYIKNPRAAKVYPCVGKLAIPKPSRIESNTFLSQTLPDLSLLGKAGAQEAKSGTLTTNVQQPRSGRRSASVAAVARIRVVGGPSGNGIDCRNGRPYDTLLCRMNGTEALSRERSSAVALARNNIQIINPIDRSTSEPDISESNAKPSVDMMVTSLTEESRSKIVRIQSYRPRPQSSQYKKSVSFSGNIHGMPETVSPFRSPPLQSGDVRRYGSPDPKVIPRHWGLYGQGPPPLAVFQPSDDQNETPNTTRPSDVDIRYHAMVKDVIKAVQETIAYFCQPPAYSSHASTSVTTSEGSSAVAETTTTTDSSSSGGCVAVGGGVGHNNYSSLAALSVSGRRSLLTVVNPLMVLISDGLLPPPTRAIFTTKPKSRIWALVEESCRPSAYLNKIECHIVNEAMNQVKALTGAITETVRFRAFVCACLNQRALQLWLNALVCNENLLKRFYLDGAFIRQCRTSLRGLYADLATHVEQLLNYPFNFDLVVEAKRPMGAASTNLGPKGALPRTSKSSPRKTGSTVGSDHGTTTPARTVNGRASSAAPAFTTKPPQKTPTSGGTAAPASSTAKVSETKMVRPSVHASSRRAVSTNAELQPLVDGASIPVPIKPSPLSVETASVMRGKLRTAFSTFRRSADANSMVPSNSLSARPPPLPPHRTTLPSGIPIPYESAPLRVLYPPAPF